MDPARFGGLGFRRGRVGAEHHILLKGQNSISSSPLLFLLRGEFLKSSKRMKIVSSLVILFWATWLPVFIYVHWQDMNQFFD